MIRLTGTFMQRIHRRWKSCWGPFFSPLCLEIDFQGWTVGYERRFGLTGIWDIEPSYLGSRYIHYTVVAHQSEASNLSQPNFTPNTDLPCRERRLFSSVFTRLSNKRKDSEGLLWGRQLQIAPSRSYIWCMWMSVCWWAQLYANGP